MSARHAKRSVVMARNGLIASSHPLASSAGLMVLREGGNAIDAAVTAAATLCVVEPTMTGIGGDLFALFWTARDNSIRALNASGRAPAAASLESVRKHGVPTHGALSISVPGAVDGWHALLSEHGTIGLDRALAPAIEYARDGFAVTEVVARQWRESEPLLNANVQAARTFLADGRAPRAGEIFANPRLAATLETLSTHGRDSFYVGEIGETIARHIGELGGWMAEADLADHRSDWVEPLRTSFLGYEVLELPPNTQGLTVLEILNLIEPRVRPTLGHNSADYVHLLVEATRIAFADRDACVADSEAMSPGVVDRLVSKTYADKRRSEIDPSLAHPSHPHPSRGTGDTVYLAAADRDGNVVSLIQSLYGAFGSGIVAGETGVILHNRGSLFSVDPTHPNCLAPGKRPLHTLIPALVLKDDRPWLAFGVMGGDMQAQGHVQVLANLLVFGMNIQEAGEAPRIRWTGDGVALEPGVPQETGDQLADRGHSLVRGTVGFGGFQAVQVDAERGVLQGGSDPRKDGQATGY